MEGALHIEPWVFFSQWINMIPSGKCDKVWIMSFGAVAWSIWLSRNERVFNNKEVDAGNVIDTIKLRLFSWYKGKWPQAMESTIEFISCLNVIKINGKKMKVRPHIDWAPPRIGVLKFNVDGAALGKPGLAGIGGVLRNHEGRVLIRFSKAVGIEESNIAEILAIREALMIFSGFPWARGSPLVVESDSSNAVGWVSNPSRVP